MRKWRKGYFTIEASIIMPIVLFLYLIIILAALYMYCRCAISQDTFLLGMRAGSFTYGEEGYGEVIYNEANTKGWSPYAYVEERLEQRKSSYPVYSYSAGSCLMDAVSVSIETINEGSGETMLKQVRRRNPIAIIREGRKG